MLSTPTVSDSPPAFAAAAAALSTALQPHRTVPNRTNGPATPFIPLTRVATTLANTPQVISVTWSDKPTDRQHPHRIEVQAARHDEKDEAEWRNLPLAPWY